MNKLKKIFPIIVLVIYWPVLFLLTHIPTLPRILAVQIPGKDKTMHFISYFMLTFFYWLACHGTVRPHFKKRHVYVTMLIMMIYGGIDEFTQQFIKGRSCDPFDWTCDTAGAASAILLLFLLYKPVHWLLIYWVGLFSFTHIPGISQVLILPPFWDQYEQLFGFIGYLILTLLFWRAISKASQFAISWKILIATVVIMPLTALVDELLSWIQHGFFDGTGFSASLFGIGLGIICATVFSQKYLSQLEAESAGYSKVIDVENLMSTGRN